MSYPLFLNNVQEITVDARTGGQQIIERFHFRSTDPTSEAADGASSTFLGNFRTLYRAQILAFHYEDFTVARYWCRQINEVLITAVGPPSRWRPVYDVQGLDWLEGGVLDVGALAVGANKKLPMHEVLRAKKIPAIFTVGYFKAGYTRFGGFTVGDKDANREDWAAATLASVQTSLDNVWNTNISAGGAESWKLAVFSPVYHGRISKPAGQAVSAAARPLQAWTPLVTVGTQITRRFFPNGLIRGS